MLVDTTCRVTLEVAAPTPMILMLRPRSGLGQWVASEQYALTPRVPVVEYNDAFGNLCQRLTAPDGRFEISTSARVDTADEIDSAPGAPFTPIQAVPDDALIFLLPSRYCPSDQMADLAHEVTGQAAPGFDQVRAIEDWIRTEITYQYGTSNASSSAVDTVRERAGVCRDFAHLGLALCRAMSIPARMVVGYLHGLEPMDLHAWFEAYVGGRWYTFDATQTERVGGRVSLAYGRDAADVALVTQFGPALLTSLEVTVQAVPTA